MKFKSGHCVHWDEPIPDSVAQAPAQLGPGCKAAYFIAAREFFSGAGAMIDSGTLSGGSSLALLEGWKSSGRIATKGPFLHAFDAFRCDYSTPMFFHEHFGGDWSEGDNFRWVYERTVQEYADYVRIYEGDITKFDCWGGPEIEILGVDVWKSEAIAQHCVRVFFPKLVIGSIVLQQDYNHIWLPHVHRIMEALSSNFEKIHETGLGGTVVFQLVRSISANEIEAALAWQGDGERGKLLAQTAARRALRSHTRIFVLIADCLREAQYNGKTSALAQLRQVEFEINDANFDRTFCDFFDTRIKQMDVYIKSLP